MKFIEFTRTNGQPVTISLHSIADVRPSRRNPRATLIRSGRRSYLIAEPYLDVLSRLASLIEDEGPGVFGPE